MQADMHKGMYLYLYVSKYANVYTDLCMSEDKHTYLTVCLYQAHMSLHVCMASSVVTKISCLA